MTSIPSYMPVLSRGAHQSPEDGACVMEYISFLAGEKWSDLPACTNGLLARAAQNVNDDMDDDERHKLLPFIGRLMGANDRSPEVTKAIVEAARKYVEPLIGHEKRLAHEEAVSAQAIGDGYPVGVISSAHLAVYFAQGDSLDYLSALIDAYDKASGRTEPAPVTEEDLRRCAELTGASA